MLKKKHPHFVALNRAGNLLPFAPFPRRSHSQSFYWEHHHRQSNRVEFIEEETLLPSFVESQENKEANDWWWCCDAKRLEGYLCHKVRYQKWVHCSSFNLAWGKAPTCRKDPIAGCGALNWILFLLWWSTGCSGCCVSSCVYSSMIGEFKWMDKNKWWGVLNLSCW